MTDPSSDKRLGLFGRVLVVHALLSQLLRLARRHSGEHAASTARRLCCSPAGEISSWRVGDTELEKLQKRSTEGLEKLWKRSTEGLEKLQKRSTHLKPGRRNADRSA